MFLFVCFTDLHYTKLFTVQKGRRRTSKGAKSTRNAAQTQKTIRHGLNKKKDFR